MKLDLTTDISAMVALYLVRALTSEGVMTTDQASKVLSTTAGWLEKIGDEFPEPYRRTPELRETTRRAKACATMLREQGLAIAYGAPLALNRKAE